MCGIGGIIRFASRGSGSLRAIEPTEGALRAMTAALRHRGPDGDGIHLDDGVGLAHTRLAIVDRAGGSQPMHLPEHGLVVVFNGEIFNHVELREELRAAGHAFRTRSDTEVVLHAFAAWGDGAVERFDGQWAIALWDERRRRLVLTRDPAGILPLHYAETPHDLVFASEIKAIFAAAPGRRAGLDPVGLAQTFTFWASIAPRTPFRGVSELPPGRLRVYEGGEVTERAFHRHVIAPRFTGTFEDAAASVGEALERSVALRMLRADVPVGSYLSGGLDSSLIAALGLRAKGEGFQTYSLRFADAAYDETDHQRTVVAAIGTRHHEVVVGRDDIARAFPAVVRHAERPLLRTSPAPMYLLSKLAADHGARVVLTGEGADEMFAGYDLFREGRVRRFWARQPDSTCRPRLLDRLYPWLARSPVAQRGMALQFFGRDLGSWRELGFAHRTRWSTTQALLRLLHPDRRPAHPGAVVDEVLASMAPEVRSWSPLAQDQAVEIETLLGPYLLSSQGDRMLMAHAVEGRFPFLGPEVMAAAHALPDAYKLRVLDEKAVLKRVAAPLLPPSIARRTKQPYRSPDALSFVGPSVAPAIDELLAPEVVTKTGVFHPPAVAALWAKCKANAGRGAFSNTDDMALVAAISTQLLVRDLLDGVA